MHGRASEVEELEAMRQRAARGHTTAAFIEGEAGIGKTRLLTELLSAAETQGARVFLGHAHALERTRPFGALADALACTWSASDPGRAEIGRLLTIGVDDDEAPVTVTRDPGLQFRVVEAFVDLLQTEAVESPVVLALEDLHWADPSTLLVLHAVGRRLEYLPFLLVGTFRPAPRVAELERIVEASSDRGGLHLSLGPLAPEPIMALVADVVDAEPGPTLMARVSGAHGNPLFVTELVRALDEVGAITIAAGRAEAIGAELPSTLRGTILRLIGFLPDGTVQALRISSVLGSTLSLSDVATATARPAVEIARVLDDAFRAGVLTDSGDQIRFRHDLVREVIYDAIPRAVRKGLHREIARRLADAGAPALKVAEHVSLGAEPGDEEAVGWLHRAAREAAPRAPTVAVDLLGRALELAGAGDPIRDQLQAERAVGLSWAGRVSEGEAVCREILGRAHDPSLDGILGQCLMYCGMGQGRIAEALTEVDRLLRSPGLPRSDRVRLQAISSFSRVFAGDLDGAVETARAVRPDTGDDLSWCIAQGTRAMAANLRGGFREALSILEEALAVADVSSGLEGHRIQLHAVLAPALIDVDRLDAAARAVHEGRRISALLGIKSDAFLWHLALMFHRFLSGDWDDAIAEYEVGLEVAEETGTRFGLGWAHSLRSLVALHRNDLAGAEEAITAAEREPPVAAPLSRADWVPWAKALLLDARGEGAQAYIALSEAWETYEARGILSERATLGPDLVHLALSVGDLARAEAVADAVGEVAQGHDVPTLDGAALRCRGLLSDDRELLLEAVEAHRKGPRPFDLARASEDAASALVRGGKREEARGLLEQAMEVYERLQAARGVLRVEASLRDIGVRRGRRGPRQRPATGWDGLTPTELRVVGLVVEGLSNPQIGERLYISPRTAQAHLTHIFAKLNLSSRTELAAAAAVRRSDASTPAP